MASADARTSLLGNGKSSSVSGETPLYHDSRENPTTKLMQLAFIIVIAVTVLITIALSIYRGAKFGSNGGLYFMLGISLLGFVVLEFIMVMFLRKGDLPREKTWFVYVVGAFVLLEAIFTNVLLFQ